MVTRFAAAALLAAASVVAASLAGCDFDAVKTAARQVTASAPPAPAPGGVVTVASFNVQVFGAAKEAKPKVFARLADVVRRFDVVALQEVRCDDPEFLGRFVEVVNSTGRNYGYVAGPRLGRTTSKEQYAFVFDADRVELAKRTVYTVTDRNDWLHREPFVARFRVRVPPPEPAFTFTLVNIHTDPDEVEHELNALDDVLAAVRHDGSGEDDVILLGDLNAGPGRLGDLGRMPGLAWAISGEPTNIRRTHCYDNLLFDSGHTTEFAGRCGVFDLESELGLSREQALELSDHLPVWAEFSTTENGPSGPPVLAGGGDRRVH